MEPIIQAKHIGKRYNIKHYRGGYVALRDVLMNIVKKPFAYIKEKAHAVTGVGGTEEFWALKDVSFDIMPGEVVGIIGSNGAGKSTLLKILTGITPPTTGEIVMRGQVASLLEVGTGFHPELTGRENIFLNGAILGMMKKEIVKKFDQIVEFAGIDKFLDTPVKYYSSGMYVRLAFSVAAHMDPDILLVDEVLAVGDAEFQKKCLGKMEEVTSGAGRTILFVSHNMAAIQKLCKKCILIEKGQIKMFGETDEVVEYYIGQQEKTQREYHIPTPKNADQIAGYLQKIQFESEQGVVGSIIPVGAPWKLRAAFMLTKPVQRCTIAMGIKTSSGVHIRVTWSKPQDLEPGNYEAVFEDPYHIMLRSGFYSCNIGLSSFQKSFHYIEDAAVLEISENGKQIDETRILRSDGGNILINPMDVSIIKTP
jgi:lipopolysaccharide transport system ATP-binding protein